jgi:catechol 2,3-dioxygenase-like lactoylglutathione lyase family enzyme
MHIVRIHHAQITIPIGAESSAREFYCDLLKLKEIPKPDILRSRGGFWLQLADQQVHVGVEEKGTDSVTKAHLAYQVDDLAVWRHELLSAGCNILSGEPIPGYERFETRDPFGNRLEFIQPIV